MTSGNLLPDPVFERGTLPPSSCSSKESQKKRANRARQRVEFPGIAARLVPLTISSPESSHREISIVGMQATGKETDTMGFTNLIDCEGPEKMSMPDAIATKNTTGGCLLTSEPAESSKLPSEAVMLQSGGEHRPLTDDLVSPQSPLVSPTLSGNKEPPSPSTTLVDDESISSDLTSVDSCPLINRSFTPAERIKSTSLRTEAKFSNSQTILHAQASPGTILPGKRHYTVRNRETSFTDSTENYYNTFAIKLQALNSQNSENSLCIERYLSQSEALWFSYIRRSRLGKPRASSPTPLACTQRLYHPNAPSETQSLDIEKMNQCVPETGHPKVTGLRSVLLIRIGDWPVYSLLIALVSMNNVLMTSSVLMLSSRARYLL